MHYLRIYIVCNDREKIDILLKNVEKKGISTLVRFEHGKERAFGIAIGRHFVAFIDDDEEGKKIYICTSPSCFKSMISIDIKPDGVNKETGAVEKANKLEIYERQGRYDFFYYQKREIDITRLKPRDNQKKMAELIVKNFMSRKDCEGNEVCHKLTVFLDGLRGTGKTSMVKLVASMLNASYCKTHNPTDAGDTISTVLRDIEPTEEHPLVLLIDEVDAMIIRVHTNSVEKHRNVPVPMHDKPSMNGYLDDFEDIDNVLLILVSNMSRAAIDVLDPSYIRPGRVHLYLTL